MTMLGKRGGDSGKLFELWVELFDHPESHLPTKPEELPAARPSLSSQPSGPAGGSTDVKQPLPPIHEEPVALSSQVHAPPTLGDEWKMWRDLIQGHFPEKPEESSSSSSSLLSGPAHGWTDVEQPLPSIPKGPSQVPSPDRAPPSPDDETNELWVEFFGHPEIHPFPKPEELPATHPPLPLAARPSWNSLSSGPTDVSTNVDEPVSIPKEPSQVASSSHAPPSPGDDESNKLWLDLYGHRLAPWRSQPLGSAHGWMDVEQPIPSIPNEPSQVASPGPAPLSPNEEALDKLWLDLYGYHFFDESLAARPSSSSQPSGPAGVPMDVEQPVPPIHKELLPVSSPDRAPPSLGDEWKVWRNLIQGHFPAKPEESESSAARPSSSSSSSLPSGPAHRWMDVEQPLSSIPKGPSQVPSPDRAPPSPDDETNELWVELFGHQESHFFPNMEELPATHPSSNSQPLGPADGRTDLEQSPPSVTEGASLDHAPAIPVSLTGSENELMKADVPQSIPVSSSKHDLQPIDAESPSGKRIKTDKRTAGAR
jgi:hypothetical protein